MVALRAAYFLRVGRYPKPHHQGIVFITLRMRSSEATLDELRHVTVVLRHGDRSPAFNPYENSPDASEYLKIWHNRADVLPGAFQQKYPVVSANVQTLDICAFPLQSLSYIGAAQSRFRGRQLVSQASLYTCRPRARETLVCRRLSIRPIFKQAF
jgi:hypothetical protein